MYLIDFGTIRNYLDVNGQHFTDQYAHYSFIGTAKFASLNAHDFKALTRRDDLECLGYTLLALLTNYSIGLFMVDESKLRTDRELHQYFVKEKRELTTIKDQDGVADSLTKIRFFISLCRQIGFQEEPEYQKLRFILEVLNQDNFSLPPTPQMIPEKNGKQPKHLKANETNLKQFPAPDDDDSP